MIAAVLVVDGLQRVVLHGLADGTLVGKRVVGEHALTVQVDGQAVVEQRRGEVQAEGPTAHVGGLQRTVIVQQSCAHAIGHAEHLVLGHIATRHAGIDFLAEGSAVDLVLPVGVGIAQGCHCVGIVGIVGSEELSEGIGAEHVDLLGHGLHRTGHVDVHARLRASLTLLRGNENHTVRSTATIDGGGRSILQDGERLDVVRVDGVQHVTTADACSADRQTVDDDQRVVRGRKRRAATDADGTAGTRRTTVGRDLHTRGLTLQQIGGRRCQTLVQLVGFYRHHRTRCITFLYRTVTDDHHVFQQLGIVLEHDVHTRSSGDLRFLVAYIAYRDGGATVSLNLEVTVKIGNHTALLSCDAHGGTDDGFAGSIHHIALHSDLLCKGSD